MYGDEKRAETIISTAVFAALITVGGWLSIPLFAVPFTLQTLFVILAAAFMKERSVLPVLLYAAAGLLGLPVFHNGAAGIGVLFGPTGGFILGFIPAALIAGFLFGRRMYFAAVISAILIIDICGMVWFMITADASLASAFTACVLPYIPGDILKGAVAVAASKRLLRVMHD